MEVEHLMDEAEGALVVRNPGPDGPLLLAQLVYLVDGDGGLHIQQIFVHPASHPLDLQAELMHHLLRFAERGGHPVRSACPVASAWLERAGVAASPVSGDPTSQPQPGRSTMDPDDPALGG